MYAGLLAQQDLKSGQSSLRQAVLIHASAGDILTGDVLVNQQLGSSRTRDYANNNQLLIGQRGLQAQDMPAAIRHIMQNLTD